MRIFKTFLVTFGLLLFVSCSKTITRWTGGKYEAKNQILSYTVSDNVFVDYGWTRPDIKSWKIDFVEGKSTIKLANNTYILEEIDGGEMKIYDNAGNYLAQDKIRESKKDIYYNKSILKIITVAKQRWVSHTVYRMESVPVQKSRQVTQYNYDYSCKCSRTSYRTEYYTAYESRSVPRTDWRWETYYVKDVEIPVYSYYWFKIADIGLFVYKIDNGTTSDYYIQNPSYYLAQDVNKLNYVCIDANSNGLFTDAQDQLMFNSWNPYSESSKFVKPNISFLDNHWFAFNRLNEDFMLDVQVTGNSFDFNYENDAYYKVTKAGKIAFDNLPKYAAVYINGKKYTIKNKKKYKIQYGIYKVRVTNRGFLDYEAKFEINKSNSNKLVNYSETESAGTLLLTSIDSENFFITISNETGFNRTYNNQKEINLPEGINKMVLNMDGVNFEFTIDISARSALRFDVEAEITKQNYTPLEISPTDSMMLGIETK